MISEADTPAVAPLLSVNDLKASYDESIILRGVSMEVKPNSVVALLGRNGVGKTSLLRSIMGLMPKTEGDIQFEGRSISGLRTDQRARAGLGYVPQGRDIFPNLTVQEIAELLGYSEVTNFRRAFMRWVELSPYQYRKRMAAPA